MNRKRFWKSKTIAGAVIVIIASIYNINIGELASVGDIDAVDSVAPSDVAVIIGAIMSIYGRFRAFKTVF